MIIARLTQSIGFSGLVNIAPFTYSFFPASFTLAAYWTTTFGAPDESVSINKIISSVTQDYAVKYSAVYSVADCKLVERSYYWDTANEVLYLHIDHDYNQYMSVFEYGDQKGFTDKTVVYIDGVYHAPLLMSVPSIAQQQDIINYDQLSFITGALVINSVGGELDDWLIDKAVYGNDVFLYYLEYIPGKSDYVDADLVGLAALYVEDFSIELQQVIINVQDQRKAQNVSIPSEVFTLAVYPDIKNELIGKPIPLAYGTIRASEAIPVDGETGAGTITFRQALLLSSLGTVQVEIDTQWVTKVPTASNLATGSFTLAEVDGRKADGTPFACRVLGSVGIPVVYASDIIKDLNQRYLNRPFLGSTYDLAEWAAAEVELEPIGILFSESVELFDAIRQVQAGANMGFRYEIKPDGRRTIRIDDWTADPLAYVMREDLMNADTLPVTTDSELLAAAALVEYSPNYYDKENLKVLDTSYAEQVLATYHQQPAVGIVTALVTETAALARAAWHLARWSEMHGVVTLVLAGPEWFTLRIYDVLDVEVTPALADGDSGTILDGREFYGIRRCQVLSVDPDFTAQTNTITAVMISKIMPILTVRITPEGDIRIAGSYSAKRAVA